MKLPQIARRVMLLACVLLMGGLSTQAQDADAVGYRLVYISLEENGDMRLTGIDIEGNETALFSQQVVGYQQTFALQAAFLSPDQAKLAIVTADGNLGLLNASGEIIAEYDFEHDLHYAAIWGWKGSNAVVVSQVVNDRFQFYEVRFTEKSPHAYRLEYLNKFFEWPVTSLHSRFIYNQPYRNLFSFSPNFRYLITAPIVEGTDTVEYREDRMLIWDTEKNALLETINGGALFWLGGSPEPSWTHSGERVIFNVYHGYELGMDLYSYDFQSSPELFKSIECKECDTVHLYWSPTSTNLAYILVDYSVSGCCDLMVLNLQTQEKVKLMDDSSSFSSLFWSPDERYIAYVDHFQPDVIPVTVLDAETGEIILFREIESPITIRSRIIGWIATP
jgi:WD40 repeat protein